MKTTLAALVALTLAALAAPARADVIPEGVRPVEHELVVELARELPGTTLVVFPTQADPPWVGRERQEGGVAVVTSGGALPRTGRFVVPHLWAVRGPLPADLATVTRAWLAEHGVESPHGFTRLNYVDEDEGVVRIRTVFRVVDVTAGAVRLEGVVEQRFGPDGKVVSTRVPAVDGAPDAPRPRAPQGGQGQGGQGRAPARGTPGVALGVAALALGALAVRRRRRR